MPSLPNKTKAIHLPSAVIGSITAKSKNNGVSFRISTPELNKDELGVIFDLQDQIVDLLIQPSDAEFPDIVTVKSEVDAKTPSQRIRGVLFVLWKQNQEGHKEFSTYYQQKMGAIIDHLKSKIEEAEV